MNAWVLLLRGVNVGGHGRLPMADLRALLATLGVRDIATHIQSGNAVFTGVIDARAFGGFLEDEIEARFGFRPRALVLSVERFAEIVETYPWPEAQTEPKAGHIWFLAVSPQPAALALLEALAAPTERVSLTGHAAYLYAPDGIGRSKLAASLERRLGAPATARNLATCATLLDMARSAARTQ